MDPLKSACGIQLGKLAAAVGVWHPRFVSGKAWTVSPSVLAGMAACTFRSGRAPRPVPHRRSEGLSGR